MTENHTDVDIIIEKFGGIRPMSTKTDIPTTTIQGWKKRGKIPAKRFEDLNQAAAKYDIDLTTPLDLDLDNIEEPKTKASDETLSAKNEDTQPTTKDKSVHNKDDVRFFIQSEIDAMENRIVKKNLIVLIGLSALILAALATLFLPSNNDDEIVSLTPAVQPEDIETVNNKADNLESRIGTLENTLTKTVSNAVTQTRTQYENQLSSLSSRIQTLEDQGIALPNMVDLKTFYTLTMAKLNDQNENAVLDNAISDLNSVYQTARNGNIDQSMNEMIDAARSQSASLGVALKNVPQKDLQAAAYLLALTKMRETLNRNQEPFEQDYALLKQIVATKNPELESALNRLAPAAEQGILTQKGLSDELKTLSGDMIAASLRGEDVSVKDKARARLSAVLNIEKNGESLTETPEQAIISKAQMQIDRGNISGAIETLETLENDTQNEVLSAFVEKAQTTITAQNVNGLINQTLQSLSIGTVRTPRTFSP